MALFWVSLAALLASCLTFFSGFGLGTLLMPVVALFLPVEVAIAVTAIVHLANNLFKLALVGKKADRSVLWRFGAPAVLAAAHRGGDLLRRGEDEDRVLDAEPVTQGGAHQRAALVSSAERTSVCSLAQR